MTDINATDFDNVDTLSQDESLDTAPDGLIVKKLTTAESTTSGTGVYTPFLKQNATGQEVASQGFNTDDDEATASNNDAGLDMSDSGTEAIQLRDVPIVYLDGIAYYEFRLDINEENNDGTDPSGELNQDLELSELQIYTSDRQAVLGDYNSGSFATRALGTDDSGVFDLIYDLDANGDNSIILRDTNSGSGADDYIFYVPVSKFAGAAPDSYVTFFSQFGPSPAEGATFEEWRIQTPSSIQGIKFADKNGDGVQDANGADNIAGTADDEGGLSGFVMYIDANNNNMLDSGEVSTVSGADGSFQFNGLLGSTTGVNYVIREAMTNEQLADYILTTGIDGDHVVTIIGQGVYNLSVGNKPIIKDFTIDKSVVSIVDGPDATVGNLADGAGDTINYLVSITNTGNVALTNVNVSDLLEGSVAVTLTPALNGNSDAIFDVGETWTFTGSYVLTQADLDSEGGGNDNIDNTAVASAEYNGEIVGPKDDSTQTPLVYNPALNVIKDVTSVTGGVNGKADTAGDIINYAISIANTGNITLTGITATDAVEGYGVTNAVYVSGDSNTNGKLDVGETWSYTASYQVTQDDLDGKGGGDGDIDNIAVGDSAETGSDSDDAVVELVYAPAIAVTKDVEAVDTAGNGLADQADDIIDYTIKIANTGNITLTGIAVTDAVESYATTDAIYVSGDADGDGKLDVGEEWTYSASYTVTQADLDGRGGGDGFLDNLATGDTNETPSDSDTEKVPLVYNPALNILKDVTSITGGVGTNGLLGANSAGDKINYAISVQNTGNITLTGIVVTDPNADADSITYVSGDLDGDGNLDVGETWNYTATHTVSQAELDNRGGGDGDVDNVATADSVETEPDTDAAEALLIYDPQVDLEKYVSVDGGLTYDDADFADGLLNVNVGAPVSFKITVENKGNVSLTDVVITDVNKTGGLPGTPIDLSGFTIQESGVANNILDVGETWTLTYTQPFDAGVHVNTASVTTAQGVGDTDDAYYYSLVNEGPGVRTPGFWSNLGYTFWDGEVGNEPKQAGTPGFADGELLYAVDSNSDGVIDSSDKIGLLVGDYNHDGLTNNGEDTLFIGLKDAQSLINASNKQMTDGVYKLGRDVVATWLNSLAGNGIGESNDTESPKHYLDHAIDWMQKFAGSNNGNDETHDIFKFSSAVKSNSSNWNSPVNGSDHSASEMHDALDRYNNSGQTEEGGTFYAHDADEGAFVTALQLLQDSPTIIGSGGGAEYSGLVDTQQFVMI